MALLTFTCRGTRWHMRADTGTRKQHARENACERGRPASNCLWSLRVSQSWERWRLNRSREEEMAIALRGRQAMGRKETKNLERADLPLRASSRLSSCLSSPRSPAAAPAAPGATIPLPFARECLPNQHLLPPLHSPRPHFLPRRALAHACQVGVVSRLARSSWIPTQRRGERGR